MPVGPSVNKHLLHYLKMLRTDRHLVYCRLPVAISPQGYSQLMVVVEFPPQEQGGASYVLGPLAGLTFFLHSLHEFSVSFLPKNTKLYFILFIELCDLCPEICLSGFKLQRSMEIPADSSCTQSKTPSCRSKLKSQQLVMKAEFSFMASSLAVNFPKFLLPNI